jgi:hypothetical protein
MVEVASREAAMASSTMIPTRRPVRATHSPTRSPRSSTGSSTPTMASAGKARAMKAMMKVSRRTRRTGAFCIDPESGVRSSTDASSRRINPPAMSARAPARMAAKVSATTISRLCAGIDGDAAGEACCMGDRPD